MSVLQILWDSFIYMLVAGVFALGGWVAWHVFFGEEVSNDKE